MIIFLILLSIFIISAGFAIVIGAAQLILFIGLKLTGKCIKQSSDWIEDKRNEYWQNEYERRWEIAKNEPWVREVIEWENNKPEVIEPEHNYAIYDVQTKSEIEYADTYEKAYWLKKLYQQDNPKALVMVKKMC